MNGLPDYEIEASDTGELWRRDHSPSDDSGHWSFVTMLTSATINVTRFLPSIDLPNLAFVDFLTAYYDIFRGELCIRIDKGACAHFSRADRTLKLLRGRKSRVITIGETPPSEACRQLPFWEGDVSRRAGSPQSRLGMKEPAGTALATGFRR